MRIGLALVCLGLAVACANAGVDVTFLEKTKNNYLLPTSGQDSLDGSSLVLSGAALLNIDPSISVVDARQAKKVGNIVKAGPFNNAHALLSVTVAGLGQVDLLGSGASGVSFAGEEDILKGLFSLKTVQNAEQTQLDTTYLPGCGEPCLEQLLLQAAEDLALNSSYSNGQGHLRGLWTFRSPGGLSTTFNLEEVADRLLALEVASFWAAAKDAAAENSRRELQDREGYASPQILSAALISPQMVRRAYGPSSEQFAHVRTVFQQLLAKVEDTLQNSFSGRLVSIITTVDEVDGAEQDLAALTATAAISRRSLLASSGDSSYLESFIAWIAMWGTFFLLLFFGLAGCSCLKGMKFQQDSLLYGKNKSD